MIYVYKSAEGLKISNNIEQETESILIQSAKDGVDIQNVIQKMNWNLEKSKSLK